MSNSLHIGLGMMVFLIALALIFDFMNGFHDSANSIATVVSTGVLKPHHAVIMAATFNFIAFYVLPHKVAATIGKCIVQASVVDQIRHSRCVDGGNFVECHYLVLRHSFLLITCLDGRFDWRRSCQKRF